MSHGSTGQASKPKNLEIKELQERIAHLERRLSAAENRAAEAENRWAEAAEDHRDLGSLLDNIPGGVTILDAAGRVKYTSRYGAALGGKRREDLEGKTIADAFGSWKFYPPEGSTPFHLDDYPVLETLRAGGSFENLEVVLQAGGVSHLLFNLRPILSESGEFAGGVVTWQDITSHKQVEAALRQSEEKYRLFFEHTGVSLSLIKLVFDEGGNLVDYLYEDWNPETEAILHLKREKAIGRSVTEVFGIDRLPEPQRSQFSHLAATGERVRFEVYSSTLNKHFLISAFPLEGHRVVSVAVDISERKRAEQALRQSEELAQQSLAELRSIYASAPVGLCFYDTQMRYQAVNETLAATNNLPAAEHIGKTIWEVLPGTIAGVVDPQLRQVLETGEPVIGQELSHPMLTAPDRMGYWRVDYHPVHSETGLILGVSVVIRDITGWKEAEAELDSLSRFPGENPSPVLRISAGGEILYANGSSQELLAAWGCEIGGFAPQFVQELVRESLETGSTLRSELALGHQTLAFIYTPVAVSRYVNVYAVDITVQKQAEQALRESEQRFRLMGEALPYGVWLCDPEGRALYTSQSFLDLLEMTAEEMQGFGWTHRLPPEEVGPTLERWLHCVRTGQDWDDEHQILGPDGKYHTVLTRGKPVRDEGGKITCWVGINLDLDERKRMEDRLERSNRDLEQFALIASHDLQEPLRKIDAFGKSILKRSDNLDECQRAYLDRMISASERMQNMIRDLLSLSQITTQGRPFMAVDLSQVAAEVISDLEVRLLRTGGKVELGDLPVVQADPLQMHQLLQNLIGNALKYHRPEVPPLVKVFAKRLPSSKVQIWVEDNGIGFEGRAVERIFQPFQRLVGKSDYEGNGMGLAICKKIVERHGGNITARSMPGIGSAFTVTLDG